MIGLIAKVLTMNWKYWESEFEKRMIEILEKQTLLDPAHDIFHVKRVVLMAKKMAEQEKAKLEVVIPAAWLHDYVNIPKDDPRRKIASKLSADEAINFLKELSYPSEFYDGIYHAIEAHSYSAELIPKDIEAKIVQDADRLDSLGAIGIARCFVVAGRMNRRIYNPNDPLCFERQPDDYQYTIDHFRRKILKLASGMNTSLAKSEGLKRHSVIESFLNQLLGEINETVS